MKLLTKAILDRFRELGSQESKGDDAIVVAKFFTPDSNWTWLATEFEETEGLFFGLVEGHYVELGYWQLEELQNLRGPLGLKVERDLHWKETTLSEVRGKLDVRHSL